MTYLSANERVSISRYLTNVGLLRSLIVRIMTICIPLQRAQCPAAHGGRARCFYQEDVMRVRRRFYVPARIKQMKIIILISVFKINLA